MATMSEDWAGLLETDLRKMFKEQYNIQPWDYLTDSNAWFLAKPDTILVPPSLERTAREVLGLSVSPPQRSVLDSIVDEQCRKLKEVSYD